MDIGIVALEGLHERLGHPVGLRATNRRKARHQIQTVSKVEVRFNWLTLSYRYKIVDTYFGVSYYTLEMTGERPLIKAKKVILKNDYIHHVIDVYHI